MSQITFFLELPPYLAQWYRNRCGGESPIKPLRGSHESDIIEAFITTLPEGQVPQVQPNEGEVAIAIPSFRHKPPMYYNYMPPAAKKALHSSIKLEFELDLWDSLHKFCNLGKQLKDLIYAYMENHGIANTETNYLAVSKAYQRKRQCHVKMQQKRDKERSNRQK